MECRRDMIYLSDYVDGYKGEKAGYVLISVRPQAGGMGKKDGVCRVEWHCPQDILRTFPPVYCFVDGSRRTGSLVAEGRSGTSTDDFMGSGKPLSALEAIFFQKNETSFIGGRRDGRDIDFETEDVEEIQVKQLLDTVTQVMADDCRKELSKEEREKEWEKKWEKEPGEIRRGMAKEYPEKEQQKFQEKFPEEDWEDIRAGMPGLNYYLGETPKQGAAIPATAIHTMERNEKTKRSRQINQQINRQVNQQINRQANQQENQQINRQVSQQINRQANQQIDRQVNQQINRQANQQINQKMNQKEEQVPESARGPLDFGELLETLPVMKLPADGIRQHCCRMELADIRRMAKKWRALANNHFLLHGYYQYKHLLFAKIGINGQEHYVIGVPGTFFCRDQYMAESFGFDDFYPLRGGNRRRGEFGYWYYYLT